MTITPTVPDTVTEVSAAPRTATRLADEDATYWLMREGLGWTVVLQLLWQVPGGLDDTVIDAFAERLRHGRLHRRLLAPRLRGARPQWVESCEASRAIIDTDAISDDTIDGWAVDEMDHADLDAAEGRCWRLRAAPTAGGDTVISLCALHLVTDGRGLVDSAATALSGLTDPPVEERGARPEPPRSGSLRADARDALGQLGAAAAGLGRAIRSARADSADGTPPDPRPPRAPMADRAPQARPSWATATVPADEWDRVAQTHGGTANTLFVAVVAGLLRSSGYAAPGIPVKVGVPVDRRLGADDDRANATAGVSVMLSDGPAPGRDLTGLRALCKDAFVRLSQGRRAPAVHLQPLIWLLPTRWVVAAATAGSGMPDAVTSNLGDVPEAAMMIGGRRARHLAFRGIADGVKSAGPHRFGDGVQSWLVRTGDEVTFSAVAFDELSFPGDRLHKLLADQLAAWSLPATIW